MPQQQIQHKVQRSSTRLRIPHHTKSPKSQEKLKAWKKSRREEDGKAPAPSPLTSAVKIALFALVSLNFPTPEAHSDVLRG